MILSSLTRAQQNTLQIGDEVMAQVLTAPQFDETQDDWVEFTERLGYYFVANAIDDRDKQRAVLRTSTGAPTYRLVKDLVLFLV